MKIIETPIPDLVLLEPKVFGDKRGYFLETYQKKYFDEVGIPTSFVQDNESLSIKATLRGLHYQINNPQGKLVRVVNGRVFDVAVDQRKSSATFGRNIIRPPTALISSNSSTPPAGAKCSKSAKNTPTA